MIKWWMWDGLEAIIKEKTNSVALESLTITITWISRMYF